MKVYISIILFVFLFVNCSKDEKTASFELSTSISPKEGGSVSSSSGTFKSGEKKQLTAVPSEGYTFVRWSGATTSTENPLTITFNSNQNITAVFEKLDTDNDGVFDDEDQCANTLAGETVDVQGCSNSQKDTDGDGVSDDLDECAGTTEGETVGDNGCPQESNNSGGDVTDDESDDDADGQGGDDDDGEDGEGDATETDSDGDGVNDDIDDCPDTPDGEAVDDQGCGDSQKDSDGDNVNDDLDVCADTPDGETVDAQGCGDSQKDSDGDGVSDAIDQCNDTADGDAIDEQGCSVSLFTPIPDSNFEQRLINEGIDDVLDGQVLTASIVNVLELSLFADERILDLSGLEAFTSLENLSISTVFVDNLDFADYPSLKNCFFMDSRSNLVTINANSNLEVFEGDNFGCEQFVSINNNSLLNIQLMDPIISSINITGSAKLEGFSDRDGGIIGEVSITNNIALTGIAFNSREIGSLDFSNNPNLSRFFMKVFENVDFLLDFSSSPKIKFVTLANDGNNDTAFTSTINISENTLLESLIIEGSGLGSLDISNNLNLTELDASNNPDLNCIRVSQGQLDNIPTDWVIESPTNYALDCPE